jgi:uncharacterized membrane protein
MAENRSSSESAHALDDARMETIMGRLLQAGVLLAAVFVLVGGAMYMAAHAGERSSYSVFKGTPIQVRHPAPLLLGLEHGAPSAIIEVGLLLLVATPICRVIFAVIAFAMERDTLYVAVSLTVLAVLLYGMLRPM